MHCMVAAKKSTKKIFVLSCSSGKLAKSRKFNFLKERCGKSYLEIIIGYFCSALHVSMLIPY